MADVTGIVAAAAVAVGGSKKDKSNADVLATARARLDLAVSALSESREDEIDDLKFYAGSPDNHWQGLLMCWLPVVLYKVKPSMPGPR